MDSRADHAVTDDLCQVVSASRRQDSRYRVTHFHRFLGTSLAISRRNQPAKGKKSERGVSRSISQAWQVIQP
jgi:hypothetical protein